MTDEDYYQHPRRNPKNMAGPFYTTGSPDQGTDAANPDNWWGDCMACEAPEAEAPELLADLNEDNADTYFVRQPATPQEITDACMAAQVCCVSALRYGGKEPNVISQLQNDPTYCDYIVDDDGQLRLTVGENGELLPFATELAEQLNHERQLLWNEANAREDEPPRKWWQFWR